MTSLSDEYMCAGCAPAPIAAGNDARMFGQGEDR